MNYDETAQYLTNAIARSGHPMPTIAIVLGSGLGKLGEKIENPLVIPYRDIPHFKASTAVGHKGNLIVGTLSHSATQPLSHSYSAGPTTTSASRGPTPPPSSTPSRRSKSDPKTSSASSLPNPSQT